MICQDDDAARGERLFRRRHPRLAAFGREEDGVDAARRAVWQSLQKEEGRTARAGEEALWHAWVESHRHWREYQVGDGAGRVKVGGPAARDRAGFIEQGEGAIALCPVLGIISLGQIGATDLVPRLQIERG